MSGLPTVYSRWIVFPARLGAAGPNIPATTLSHYETLRSTPRAELSRDVSNYTILRILGFCGVTGNEIGGRNDAETNQSCLVG